MESWKGIQKGHSHNAAEFGKESKGGTVSNAKISDGIYFYSILLTFYSIESVSSKEQSRVRPQALNTVELMRICSSGLGIGPFQAMQIAERLYTQGYISYPRTETNQYPANFDLK